MRLHCPLSDFLLTSVLPSLLFIVVLVIERNPPGGELSLLPPPLPPGIYFLEFFLSALPLGSSSTAGHAVFEEEDSVGAACRPTSHNDVHSQTPPPLSPYLATRDIE